MSMKKEKSRTILCQARLSSEEHELVSKAALSERRSLSAFLCVAAIERAKVVLGKDIASDHFIPPGLRTK